MKKHTRVKLGAQKGLTLDDYQQEARKTAVYPHRGAIGGLIYTALGLAGEAGELANKVKKMIRGDGNFTELQVGVAEELGDVLWYCSQLALELRTPLSLIAYWNQKKLKARNAHGTLKGSGDKR